MPVLHRLPVRLFLAACLGLFGTQTTVFAQGSDSCQTVLIDLTEQALGAPKIRIDNPTEERLRQTRTVQIPADGIYDINMRVDYNSGNNQINETFYVEVSQNGQPFRGPLNPNTSDGLYKIIVDPMDVDPASPHRFRDTGQFELQAGEVEIRISHFGIIAYDTTSAGEYKYLEFVNRYPNAGRSVEVCASSVDCLGGLKKAESVRVEFISLSTPQCDIDVELTQTLSTTCVQQSGDYAYIFSISNNGSQTASGVQLRTHLSSFSKIREPERFRIKEEEIELDAVQNELYILELGDIPGGTTLTDTIRFSVADIPGDVEEIISSSRVLAAGDQDFSNNAAISRAPVRNYNMELSSRSQTRRMRSGGEQRVTFSAENLGPDQAEAYTLAVSLPPGISAAGNLSAFLPRNPDEIRDNGTVLIWSDALPFTSGDMASYSFSFSAPDFDADSTLRFDAQIFSDCDVSLADNSTFLDITVSTMVIDLAHTQTPSVSELRPGDTFSYLMRVINVGELTAGDYTLTDTISGLLIPDFGDFPPVNTSQDTIFTWEFFNDADTLAVGDTLEFTFNCTARDPREMNLAGLAPGTSIAEMIPLYSGSSVAHPQDVDLSNNADNSVVQLIIDQGYNLGITKTATSPQTILINGSTFPLLPAGEIYTYTVRVENQGPDPASNLVIQDILPPELSPDSLIQSSFTPRSPDVVGSNSITWNEAALPAGESLTYTYQARAPRILPQAPLALTNTVTVDAPNDSNPDDNSASATIYIGPPQAGFCESFSLDRNIYRANDPSEGPLLLFFDLDRRSTLEISIFDLAGTLIQTLADNVSFDVGRHQLQWNGESNSRQNTGSGVYVLTLRRDNECCWLKFMVVR